MRKQLAHRAVSGFGVSPRIHVVAVPEAETWVMLLVGLGLVAYQLRRKQRLLEQRPTMLAAA